MTLTWRTVCLVIAIVLFFIGAMFSFPWFGTTGGIAKGLGFDSLGLIAFAAAHL
jgi:hypothetical protein